MTPRGWIALEVDSLTLAHPVGWTADVQREEEGTNIFLQSDAVSFGVVGLYASEQEPQSIVDQVSDSVRAEHPGLELDPLENDEERYPQGVACEGLFMTLDTVAYCWIRCWRLAKRCVLVYVQTVEPESAESEQIFRDLCESVEVQGGRRAPSQRGLAEPRSAVE